MTRMPRLRSVCVERTERQYGGYRTALVYSGMIGLLSVDTVVRERCIELV